jgi:hypothetical protein
MSGFFASASAPATAGSPAPAPVSAIDKYDEYDEEEEEKIKLTIRKSTGGYMTIRDLYTILISDLKIRISRRLYRENLKKELQKQKDGIENLIGPPPSATSATSAPAVASATSATSVPAGTSATSATSALDTISPETRTKIITEYAKKFKLYYHGKELYDISNGTTMKLSNYQTVYQMPDGKEEDIILDLVVYEPKVYNSDTVEVLFMENTLFYPNSSIYSGYETSPFIRTAYIRVTDKEPETFSYDWFKAHSDNIDAKLSAAKRMATGKRINTKKMRFTIKNINRAKTI